MKVDTSLNVLASYAYCGKDKQMMGALVNAVTNRRLNLMIDSGAFTKHNAKGNFNHVTVDKYCDFLHEYGALAEKYVMLDVVGDAVNSRKNYETMLSRGLNPMFVMTMFDKDYAYMKDAVSSNPHICVAGGVTTKGKWMTKRFQDVYRESGHRALIHGLGYVTYPRMLQLPLHSVGSSTWNVAAVCYGIMNVFSPIHGSWSLNHSELEQGRKLTTDEKLFLQRIEVTPRMLFNRDYHRGKASLARFTCLWSAIRRQKVCKKSGLDLFLAVGDRRNIDLLLWMNENPNATYTDFRKEFAGHDQNRG